LPTWVSRDGGRGSWGARKAERREERGAGSVSFSSVRWRVRKTGRGPELCGSPTGTLSSSKNSCFHMDFALGPALSRATRPANALAPIDKPAVVARAGFPGYSPHGVIAPRQASNHGKLGGLKIWGGEQVLCQKRAPRPPGKLAGLHACAGQNDASRKIRIVTRFARARRNSRRIRILFLSSKSQINAKEAARGPRQGGNAWRAAKC